MHTKGEAPKGFLCPQDGCQFAHLTSAAAVWEHAEAEHGIKADPGRCLWDGCDFGRRAPSDYVRHEPTHTGVWPHSCMQCGKGHKHASFAVQCCQVQHMCNCGAAFRGQKSNAKRCWASHTKKCKAGAAPLPPAIAAN